MTVGIAVLSLAFEHRASLTAYPLPGSQIYYGGRRSDPVLNPKKAREFWERVVEHVGELLEDLVVRWDREGYPAPRSRKAAGSAGNGGAGGANGHGSGPGTGHGTGHAPPRRTRK